MNVTSGRGHVRPPRRASPPGGAAGRQPRAALVHAPCKANAACARAALLVRRTPGFSVSWVPFEEASATLSPEEPRGRQWNCKEPDVYCASRRFWKPCVSPVGKWFGFFRQVAISNVLPCRCSPGTYGYLHTVTISFLRRVLRALGCGLPRKPRPGAPARCVPLRALRGKAAPRLSRHRTEEICNEAVPRSKP